MDFKHRYEDILRYTEGNPYDELYKIYYENDMLHPYSITVNGSFATIDVSSFQEGYYTIFIFTPLRNTYVKNIYIYYDKKTPHFGFGD